MARLLSLLLVALCWRQPCCSATVFHAVGHRSRQPTKSAQPASLPEALHGAASQQDSDAFSPTYWFRRRRLLHANAARDATVDEAAAAAADEEDALAAGDQEQAEEAEVLESAEGGDEYQVKTPDREDTEAEEEDVAERVFPNAEDAEGYQRLKCDRFQVTYKQIDHDLAIHRELGTHLGSTQYAMTEQRRKNGFGIGFFGGRAYLLTPIRGEDWQRLAHHAKLYVAYLRMMTHLEAVFGAAIPDVVLVITTSDTPRYVSPLRVNVSTPRPYPPQRAVHMPTFVPGPYPVAGICKSDFWPDLLLIPNFHFHTKLYDNATLSHIREHRDKHPWGSRQPVVFGRFSHYSLHRKSDDHSTFKLGLGGQHICQEGNTSCAVREHFISEVVNKDRARRLDVRFSGKQPMSSHARYKYLINLSGQSISSRLEQLLPLGSAVLTEPTSVGYYAYYYRTLLRHRVNVLEFWRRLPEEVFDELDWAAAHDEEAAAIAAEGVRTAETYLTGNGRTCYWYRLLHGLSRTLRFTPRLGHWPEAVPLRQLLEEDLPGAPGGQALAEAPWAP